MKPLVIPPKFEAEILRKAALKLVRIAFALEKKGDVFQADVLLHRAKELEEQAKHRIN